MPEQAYLLSIKEALATLRVAAEETEAVLPDEVQKHKWMAAKHSPTPWETVYAHYRNTDCDSEMLFNLAIRSQLADVVEKLNWCVVQAEAEGKPINLRLARMNRQTIQIERSGPKRLPPLAYEELP